jgi:hypothetical protein
VAAGAERRTPTVIVVSEHYHDDALRRRMHEAHPDYFHDRTHLYDGADLCALVLHPAQVSSAVPPCADMEALFRHGVTAYTRVNRAVVFAREREVMELLAARLEPRSRAWLRLRKEFNREARLTPVTTDGRTPDRTQDYPSLPQISRFLTWATRVNRGHHMPNDGTDFGRRSLDRARNDLVLAGGRYRASDPGEPRLSERAMPAAIRGADRGNINVDLVDAGARTRASRSA